MHAHSWLKAGCGYAPAPGLLKLFEACILVCLYVCMYAKLFVYVSKLLYSMLKAAST